MNSQGAIMDQAAIGQLEQQIDDEAKKRFPARCSGSQCCNTAMTR